MDNQKLQAKVVRRIVNTPDVVTIYFTIDGKPLQYQAGQYITVYFDDTNVTEGRAYSLSSCPSDLQTSITVKKLGLFSGKLHDLKVGDTFSISQAYGFFDIGGDKPIISLAGGVGIAPIWSIVRHECEKNNNHKITLLYSNHTPEDIVFRSEIETLARENNNFSARFFVTQETGAGATSRRIDLSQDIPADMMNSIFYVCGSVEFSRSMWRQLQEIGVSEDNISTETFFEAS